MEYKGPMRFRNGRRGWAEYRYKLTVKVSDEDASSKGFFLIVNHNFIAEYVCICMYMCVWYYKAHGILIIMNQCFIDL